MKNLLSSIFLSLIFAFVITAQQPSSQPVLRLETGMHTAQINRIGVDAANRYLVTASGDKTARVWDLASGELLRVLRVPVGEGNEGKLFATAISPDGDTIAVGGWTGYEWDNTHSIYLFDRASGRMLRRLSGLPNVINHLTFSRDGRFLAATLNGKNGVRLYETNGYRQIGVDADYGNDGYGADFNSVGNRLVASCYDGFIRIYAVGADGLRLLAKRTADGGKRPFSVKFSPDGNKIAVGFTDTTNVNVLSATDLSLLYSPDTGDVHNGSLASVAWSGDGNTLYAGGRYQASGNRLIRGWRDGGRGKFFDTAASTNTIFDIQPLRNGGVIYGAGEPSWGVIDKNGRRSKFVTSSIADYRALLDNFRLSPDAMTVGFGYQYGGKEPARFSIANKQLETGTNGANLSPPRTTGLNVTDWYKTYEPKLGGVKLTLEQNDFSRSLAIAPDNSKFLLGTDYFIRLFDDGGRELWKVAAPSVAWSVNISGDGRFAVAAYGDGTIRWYRISDGKELLAFFPHADKKRWVLWTPSGYYDASANGEELIGWHINNGKDAAADFFPVGQFRNQFYRPDVISQILYAADEAKALQTANEAANRRNQPTVTVAQQLPPVVNILSPSDNDEVSNNTITLRYNVRTPSGEPVTKVRFMIDGRPIEARGAGVKTVGDQTATINIPQKDCTLSVIAENQYTTSEASAIRLKWKGQIASELFKPKLYILAIGVSKYQNNDLTLGFPAKDATDFVNVMLKQKGLLYSDVVVKVLTDEKATRAEIVDGLDWISRETTSKDVAMVFMAGHGDNDQYGQYYFLPHDINADKIKSTGVVFSEIENTIKNLAGKTLFFIDTCKSANAVGSKKRELPDVIRIVNELSSAENGAIVFTASTKNQASLEDVAWNNGAFTKALVEGLGGSADKQNTGRVTVAMLDLYITERVKQLTNGRQSPVTQKPDTVPDFPLALRK